MVKQVTDTQVHKLPLLPLKNVVMLPKSIIPIMVGRASSIEAIEHALSHDKEVFVTAQKNSATEHPSEHDVYTVGVRATILQVTRVQKGALKILVEGLCRSKALEVTSQDGFLVCNAEDLPSKNVRKSAELEALWRNLRSLYSTYSQNNPKVPAGLLTAEATPEDMDGIVDTLALHITLTIDERQKFLETVDLKKRIHQLSIAIQKELEILEIEERIKGHVQTQVEKNQREYYLTEQIKAIQKELGREDQSSELQDLLTKAQKLGMSAQAIEKVEKEIKRLEHMQPMSAEASVSRSYVEWLVSLPWSKASKDTLSMVQAERVLDSTHAGLEKPKERILEFVAAQKFSKSSRRAPVLCLVGPPGVGKTSIGRAVAKSLDREFVRISLGGVNDEAEIRGHRRTYIGSMPGRIIRAMRDAKTVNPVILLDEIDKMSHSPHGDPAAALLEVLDPEQNREFTDHYLEVGYDLSQVLFIATANHIEGIPHALFDRMEIISLAGYTEDEKVAIAQKFLIPKNLKELGLTASQCSFSKDAVRLIISEYTKESGVRQLERIVARIMRKAIQMLLQDPDLKRVSITPERVRTFLKTAPFKRRDLLICGGDECGIATGLAWTEVGGDILEIEVAVLPGKGTLTLTGQLGDVMQESAQAALTYVRSRAEAFGLDKNFHSTVDIHIHVPEGATPKDGPSAGITMCTALVSALTKIPVHKTVAMTGEITLRGRVLAVGGLKEKLLAAKQYGITKVLVPLECKDKIEEFYATLTDLTVVYVCEMDTVLREALTRNPFASPETTPVNLEQPTSIHSTVKATV